MHPLNDDDGFYSQSRPMLQLAIIHIVHYTTKCNVAMAKIQQLDQYKLKIHVETEIFAVHGHPPEIPVHLIFPIDFFQTIADTT